VLVAENGMTKCIPDGNAICGMLLMSQIFTANEIFGLTVEIYSRMSKALSYVLSVNTQWEI